MNTENQEWNPDNEEAIPAELLSTYEANAEEQGLVYMEEETVVGTVSNFLNIEGSEFGNQIFNALKEGNADPIKTLLMIKKMQHLHEYFLGSDVARTNKEAKAWFRDKIINTLGGEKYQAYGATISIEAIGGATTMDYKECGDLYLNRLYELTAQLKEMVKEREKYIKTELPAEVKTLGIRSLKEEYWSLPILGEEQLEDKLKANVIPPIKYSREGIVVRFARKKK